MILNLLEGVMVVEAKVLQGLLALWVLKDFLHIK
jgi:hypothetical protein